MAVDRAAFGSAAALQSPQSVGLGRVRCAQRPWARRTIPAARASGPIPQLTGDDLPPIAGSGPLSRLANVLISFEPLLDTMHRLARSLVMSRAERWGVLWGANVSALEEAFSEDVRREALESITNPNVVYPEYYVMPFHAYKEGNLGWKPAFEVDSATQSIALNVWRKEGLTLRPEQAEERMRERYFDSVLDFAPTGWCTAETFTAVDVGCAAGSSTVRLAMRLRKERGEYSRTARVIGLDASPYFLAVARHFAERDNDWRSQEQITYKHALAEESGLGDSSVNWWCVQFVMHELPAQAISDVLVEAFRVLKPGGVFSMVDVDPRSRTIRKAPAFLATLYKSTEPYADEYFSTDFVALLKRIGFRDVLEIPANRRHRTIAAVK